MTFLGHMFSAILLPVFAITGFLFGGHPTSQTPQPTPIVQEASTSSVSMSEQATSASSVRAKPNATPSSSSASAKADTNIAVPSPANAPQAATNLTQSGATVSGDISHPGQVLCSGSYYPACPKEQQFICANDGINPYCQVPQPPATVAQVSEIAQLCSYATAQSNTQVMQYCADGSILNGYNSNAIFRSDIDNIYQELQQKISQKQTAINNQIYVQNWISALNAAGEINQSFVSEQNALSAKAVAEQEQQQDAQILQTVQRNQQLLQQQFANTPVKTHCGIDAGVFSCNIPN